MGEKSFPDGRQGVPLFGRVGDPVGESKVGDVVFRALGWRGRGESREVGEDGVEEGEVEGGDGAIEFGGGVMDRSPSKPQK